jgi:hypothetical protein
MVCWLGARRVVKVVPMTLATILGDNSSQTHRTMSGGFRSLRLAPIVCTDGDVRPAPAVLHRRLGPPERRVTRRRQ